jgi:hypothetical protein
VEDNIKSLVHRCSTIEFGRITLSDGETKFYDGLNNEIILIIKSLPEPAQTPTLLELMNHLGLSVREAVDFFKGFYTPAWSILYWLFVSFSGGRRLSAADLKNIRTVHATAMLLHLIDDHLNDREMAATHLALLLRSQLWMFMNHALDNLAEGIDGGAAIAQGFIDDYYSSIMKSGEVDSLDAYCDLFKKQMGTGFIAPVLMTKKMTADDQVINAVQAAYGAFGTAWRLLDDIQDIPLDMQTNRKSSVYICLPENSRVHWNQNGRSTALTKSDHTKHIIDCIFDNKIIGRIINKIYCELDSAVSISDAFKIRGFSNELLYLLEPLRTNRELREFRN